MQEKSFKNAIFQLSQCNWVQEELKDTSFGDQRLFLRLLVVAKHFAQHPMAPINQANGLWRKTKAAYRFFDNKKVSSDLILGSHYGKTEERIKNHCGIILVAQDTTFLNFSHMRSSTDLGSIGGNSLDCKGLVMHSSIAFTEHGLPLGLLDQEIWARSIEPYRKPNNRHKLPIEKKESNKWLKALKNYSCLLTKEKTITVCDRESDIYDFFVQAQKLSAQVLVRACDNKRVKDGDQESNLKKFMLNKDVVDTAVVEIPREDRKSNVEIRVSPVEVLCPPLKLKTFENCRSLKLYAIYVSEPKPPKNTTPLSWMLLTNIEDPHKIAPLRYIEWYKRRWQIEVFHKVLKSGCQIEKARLEKNHRRFPYLGLYSIIAWKLLQIVHFARVNPQDKASALLTSAECDVLYAITHDTMETGKSFNAKKAVRWLAQLGGYLARRSDPKPGPTHVWRGWQRLQDFTRMYSITKSCTYG